MTKQEMNYERLRELIPDLASAEGLLTVPLGPTKGLVVTVQSSSNTSMMVRIATAVDDEGAKPTVLASVNHDRKSVSILMSDCFRSLDEPGEELDEDSDSMLARWMAAEVS